MEVKAVNHDYGFRLSARTDSAGSVNMNLMPGTWDFFATPTHERMWRDENVGRGYFLTRCETSIDPARTNVLISPVTNYLVHLQSDCFDLKERENYISFVNEPYGRFISPSQAGVTRDDKMILFSTPGLSVGSRVTSPRDGEELCFVQEPRILAPDFSISIMRKDTCLLVGEAQDPSGRPISSDMMVFSPHYSWENNGHGTLLFKAPQANRLRVSPGEYSLNLTMMAGNQTDGYVRASLNPRVVKLDRGETRIFRMGGRLSFGPVRTTPQCFEASSPATEILLNISDEFGNQIIDIQPWASSLQMRPEIVVTSGSENSPLFANFLSMACNLAREWPRDLDPQYRIAYDFGPYGNGLVTGPLYGKAERSLSFDQSNLVLIQAPHVPGEEVINRKWLQHHHLLNEAMERILGVPFDYEVGIIKDIRVKGFADEAQHTYK